MKKLLPAFFLLLLTASISQTFAQSNAMPADSARRVAMFKKNVEKFTGDLKNAGDPKSQGTIHMLRGMNEAALKQFNAAISDYDSALKLNPQLQLAYLYRAGCYEAIKNYVVAVKDYEACLLFIKDNSAATAGIYNGIAKLQLRLRQFDKVIQSDSIALSPAPQLNDAHVNRAWAYMATRKYENAIDDFIKGMPAYQTNKNMLAAIYVALGDAYRYSKKYKPAINNYSTAIQLNPDNKLAYWNLAAGYNMNGDYQLADENYTRAIAFYKGDNKNLARLYDDRALMETGQHQYKKAIADDSVAIAMDDKFAVPYWNRADAYAQNADFKQSAEAYLQTMVFYQNDQRAMAELYNDLANEEYFMNDYQKVITYSTSSISLNDKTPASYLNRGRAYLKMNDKEHAMSDFNKIIALDTAKESFEYAFALNYTGNPQAALQLMQKKILSTTNDYLLITHYYNIACLLSLMNRAEEANIYLKKCVDAGYPKKYAINDPDLDNIRSTQEYKDATR